MAARVFQYHAHGFALGGTITSPFKAELDSHAATTLPIVGGYASAKTQNFRFKDLVTYDFAHTYISGIRNDDGTHSTVVNTLIQRLNILDVITADAVIGRLSSKHLEDDSEPEIIPLGSSFENLRIAGIPVQVDLENDLYLKHPTYSALTNHLNSQASEAGGQGQSGGTGRVRYLWEQASDGFPSHLEKGMLIPRYAGFVHSKGILHTSLVKQVRPVDTSSDATTVPFGYAIQVSQVGSLYLGEMFTTGNTKRLNMLRIEMGSPIVGTLACAGPVTNGGWYP